MREITVPVGSIHYEPIHRYRDARTGQEVRRLTDLGTHCHHPYFYCRAFTPDSRRALVVSHRTGKACAYLVDVESGESVQLTDCDGLDGFLISLTPDGRHLFYSEGGRLHRLALDGFADEVVWKQQAPWDGGGVYPGYSDDFRSALFCQMHRDDKFEGKAGWDFFEPQWRLRPRCRLVLVDLTTGAERVLREEACWLGHPQIRPGDPNTLMYCHEGPSHLIDARIWLMNADGSNVRPMGYVEKEPGAGVGETVTHEYFTPDGQHIAFTHFPARYAREGSIRLMHVETMAETVLGRVHDYSHFFHSPDCRRIVGDEAKGDGREENCIWLFDIATREERPVCVHGSSFAPRGKSTQDAHPHPSFSPDGRWVLFSSDRETSPTGNCAVYLASTVGIFEE